MGSEPDRSHLAWLFGIIVAAIGLRLLFAPWLAGDDDLSLAGSALDLLHHGFTVPGGNYGADYGITVPLAAVFAAVGVGLWQLALPSLIYAGIGVYVVYRIGARMFDPLAGLLGAAALAFFPMSVEFSTLSFPDQPQGVVLGLAFLCALNAGDAVEGRRGVAWAIAAGAWWAFGYYIRIDSFFMGFVFLLALGLGFLPWRHLFVIGAVTGLLVGLELAIFARVTGNPFYHAHLEHLASAEVLAPTMNYRNLLAYPKVMFVTPYDSGVQFYLLAVALIRVAIRPCRAGLMLAGWVAIFLVWLWFGVDPFAHPIQLKAQLGRYLLSFCVPMSVLIGWLLVDLYRRGWRALSIAAGAVAIAVALAFMQFNLLNFEPALATVRATEAARRRGWFPLYTDSQSRGIVSFILQGTKETAMVAPAQEHDFLNGTTRFVHIPGDKAYLLINWDFARQLHRRNLETEISASRFGMTATLICSIDNPEPAWSYDVLRGLAAVAALVPLPGLSARVKATALAVLRPGDAQIFLLRRAAPAAISPAAISPAAISPAAISPATPPGR